MRKHFFFLLICILSAAVSTLGQSRPDLFNYVKNPTLSPRQLHFLQGIAKNPVNISVRLVTINQELFEGAAPIRLNFDGLAETGSGEITIRQVEFDRRGTAEYSGRGSVDGWPLAGANFVYDKGFVHGSITMSDVLYGIAPIGEGLHVLIKKSPSQFQEEGCRKIERQTGESPAPEKSPFLKTQGEQITAVGDCRIRLLVAFTDDVLAAHANPRGEIQLATDTYNTANQNSNFSFAHEFGHLLNARHDTFVDATAGTNHALVNMTDSWRTVMAYNDACDCSDEVSPCPVLASRATQRMPSCNRVQWWSNPAVNFSGSPTGLNTRRDNRSALNVADNGVIAFEGRVVHKTVAAAETVAQQEEGNLLAEQSIENTAGINVHYLNDGKGTYQAGNTITLRPGFWAQSGADFRAFIDGCAITLAVQEDAANRATVPAFEDEPILRISPNPVTERLGLDYTVVAPGTISIGLFNNLGVQLQTLVSSTEHNTGNYRVEAAMDHLPEGVYYIRYTDRHSIRVVPVVKVGL